MELKLSQRQVQTLSPQMLQSMEILQMGSQELLEYIQEAVQENPVLEQADQYDKLEEYAKLKRTLNWLESSDVQNRHYHQQDAEGEDDPLRNYGTTEDDAETLCEHLLAQLKGKQLPDAIRRGAAFLIASLNANGWLDEDIGMLAEELNCPKGLLFQALDVVQSLEPAGVGARNLGECLRLQLVRMENPCRLALQIAQNYLEALARKRYGLIARELGVTQDEVRQACEMIRALNPRPGAEFAAEEKAVYINPDLIVITHPDRLELMPNDYFFPTLHISSYYTRLMNTQDEDEEVRQYLTDKVRQAKWVVRAIEQRRSTLLDCARCILEIQEAFFRKGPGYLVPMTLASVAQQLGVHESTVSRALKDKYLQCSMGVFPLTHFFSRGLPGVSGEEGTVSPESAKLLLKKLIDGEDKRKPLSDQKLCELMEQEGCAISRRTVAKYRDELNIPCTTGRKNYE